jgi:thiol-disulfide isomerase/thioredoxin
MKLLERIANVFVIVGISAFLAIVAHNQLLSSGRQLKSPAAAAEALKGKVIRVSGLTFPRPRASVLLVISTSCHFCQESLPFYSALSSSLGGKADILAVLPQPQQEAAEFLKAANVEVTQLATASPSQLGVGGTPTLLLLDPNGKVQDVWLGRLDEVRQAQVRSRLAQL